MTTVSIREIFKKQNKVNPISGHEWIEHGPTTSFQVIGAVGVHSRHRTIVGAEKAKQELQNFYNKFDL
jgi:hypothetical protein